MEYFINQLKKHPDMAAQDLVKMAFQRAFGAKHMLNAPQEAFDYLKKEMAEIEETDEELFEEISPVYCRVNLGAWKRMGFSAEDLFELFCKSAKEHSDLPFEQQLDCAFKALAKCGNAKLTDELERFLQEYKNGPVRPVHHSKEYSLQENPHYRVVRTDFVQLNK